MGFLERLLSWPVAYAAFHRLVSQGKLSELGRFLDALPDQRPMRALDLGCGPGTNTPAFLSRGFGYLGVDLEPRYIESATQRLSARFLCEDATRLSLGERFDVVLLNSVLHHLDDAGALALLQTAGRHVAEGGTVVVIDQVRPEGLSPAELLRQGLLWMDRGAWSRREPALEAMLRRSFKEVTGRAFPLELLGVTLWEMRLYACGQPRGT